MGAGAKPSRRLGLDLASVRLALMIAERRSLRRTAMAVGMSEAALSHRLRALEDVLTVSLFHRSSVGVEPTLAGLAFFEEARKALDLLDLAVANAGAISRGAAGRLTLGLTTSLSAGRLPIALSAYAEEHPEVDLQFVEGDRSRMVEGINSRAIDIAVLHGAPDNKLGEPLMLWHERLYVLIAADHRLAGRSEVLWSDIEEETFLVAARTVGAEAVQLLAGRYGRGRSPVTRSHLISRETALSMVGMSLGLTLMLESGLGRLPQGVVAIPLASSDGETLIPLTAYRDPSNDNPPLRRLWSFLKRGYAESGRAAAE
jgi:DNA-binding transcriptional LysR family regulator